MTYKGESETVPSVRQVAVVTLQNNSPVTNMFMNRKKTDIVVSTSLAVETLKENMMNHTNFQKGFVPLITFNSF